VSDLVAHRGDVFLIPPEAESKFTDGITRHHRAYYEDYTVAKLHMLEALGDISDVSVFGRQVLVGVFCRPNITPGGIIQLVKEIQEDWWQNKAAMILKLGPGAFKGADSYLEEMFGDAAAPKPGDWVFANANAGIQINLAGDGARRPQRRDNLGREMDLFDWNGWPCRVIPDDQFIGRLDKPHMVV
jgi:hypothetical protein